MAHVFKKPLIPLIIMIILLALYFTRWDKEVTIKPNAAVQSIYKTDRWTGQRWVTQYVGNRVNETPVIDEYLVASYAENVKTLPDIKGKAEFEAIKPQGFAAMLSLPKQKLYEDALSRISIEVSRTELGNQAWAKRKYYSWAWDGLFALSSLWLLVSIFLKNKKAGAV